MRKQFANAVSLFCLFTEANKGLKNYMELLKTLPEPSVYALKIFDIFKKTLNLQIHIRETVNILKSVQSKA